jgi:hypothetical protein
VQAGDLVGTVPVSVEALLLISELGVDCLLYFLQKGFVADLIRQTGA